MDRIRTAWRRMPLPLALLLFATAVISVSWGFATAPLQGPDEPAHVAYVAHLAETGDIPSSSAGTHPYGDDETTALFGYRYGPILQNRDGKPPWSSLEERQFRTFEDHLPDGAPGTGEGPNALAKNPPLYYVYASIGWKLTPGGHFFGRLFVLRLMGTLLLLAMVAFAWLIGGEVFRRRLPQIATAGFVALLPMSGFMSGVVNTDIMLATIWTCFTWLALRAVRLGPTWPRCALLSLMTVLSVLTHGRGLAIVPALLVVLVLAWGRHRPALRPTAIAAGASAAVLAVGLLIYRLLASAGGAGGSLYGGEVNLGNSAAFSVKQFINSVWQFYLPRLSFMEPRIGPAYGYRQMVVNEFLGGQFGSFEVGYSGTVYDLVNFAFLGLLLAVWTVAARRWPIVVSRWPVIVVLATVAVCLVGFLHLASYRALANGGGADPLIVGRYLLPGVAVLGVLFGIVVAGVPRRAAPVVAAVGLCVLFFMSLGGIALSVERFYA